MNRQEIYRRIYTLMVSGVNILVQTGVVGWVWYKYYNPLIRIPFWTKGHWYILTIYCFALLFFTHIYGGLKIGYLKRPDALLSQIFAALCSNVVFYAEISLLAYYFPTPAPLLYATIFNLLFIVIWLLVTVAVYNFLFPPHKVLLIYGRNKEQDAVKKLKQRADKFTIKAAISAETELRVIVNQLSHFHSVVLWDIPNAIRNEILKECYSRKIRVYSMPSISDILLSGSELMHFFDTPLFLIRSNPLTVDQMVVKRILDLIFACFVLLLVWPIMLITAILIKVYDKGPILYKQIRCTIHGREFYIYKFRSMVIDAEKDGVAKLASRRDSRITPIGLIIRKLRIDELPQLFNVIKGDMSFVGPRPERPEILAEYKKSLPEFEYRMHVKAGLTGYAQIYGKYNTKPYDKLKLDLYYIEHYSLWLDIKLLILTAKIIFSMESTEGVEDAD